MNTTDYELLDVKKSSSQTELNAIDVIITIRRNSDKKVITSTITKSFGYYNDLMSAIEQFGHLLKSQFKMLYLKAKKQSLG